MKPGPHQRKDIPFQIGVMMVMIVSRKFTQWCLHQWSSSDNHQCKHAVLKGLHQNKSLFLDVGEWTESCPEGTKSGQWCASTGTNAPEHSATEQHRAKLCVVKWALNVEAQGTSTLRQVSSDLRGTTRTIKRPRDPE